MIKSRPIKWDDSEEQNKKKETKHREIYWKGRQRTFFIYFTDRGGIKI